MRISEDDPNFTLKVMSENGEVLGVLSRNKEGDFVFNRKELEEEKLLSAKRLKKIREAKLSDKPYVYFDFGKSTLNEYSKGELIKANSILNDDPLKKIEISSHTDSRGPAEYNMWLAQQRSSSIKKYLVDHGIDSKRIVVRNYGETKPINECVDGVKCSMEKHAENRRTELKIFR
jgi:outer membrane protein OmpA-like peptidoglycan-associated protein